LKHYYLFLVLTVHICCCFSGGYVTGSEAPRIVREAILRLYHMLKDNAVTLVDVLAPTDFILNSPIGASDGEV
jgi:acyl-CoA oxidase